MVDLKPDFSIPALEAMADFGRQLGAGADFTDTCDHMLRRVADWLSAECAALYSCQNARDELRLVVAKRHSYISYPSRIALTSSQLATMESGAHEHFGFFEFQRLFQGSMHDQESSIRPDLFTVLVPLRFGAKLVGAIGLGRRGDGATYSEADLGGMALLTSYLAIALINVDLVSRLQQQVQDNLRLLATLQQSYDQTLEAFAQAIDAKHATLRGHSQRVASYAVSVARALGVDAGSISNIHAAGHLYDIGKVIVDKPIFYKSSALRPDEFREIADHTVMGYQIVANIKFPWPEIPDVVRWHHERADGSGYPDHLHNEDLPLAVRVIAAMDTFDAMLSDRPYRGRLSVQQAAAELVQLTPQKFDASVVLGLLSQLDMEAQGKSPSRVFPGSFESPHTGEFDELAFSLLKKINSQRVYFA